MDSRKRRENYYIPVPKMSDPNNFHKLMYLANRRDLLGAVGIDPPARNTNTEEDLWDYGQLKRKDLHFFDCLSCWIRCMDLIPLSFPGPEARCECQYQVPRVSSTKECGQRNHPDLGTGKAYGGCWNWMENNDCIECGSFMSGSLSTRIDAVTRTFKI